MPLVALLVGPPGSGKTTAACSGKGTKLMIDADAKAGDMVNLAPQIASGELTVWPINARLVDEPFTQRALRMLKDHQPPATEPQGYLDFCRLSQKIDTDPIAEKADWWIIDSLTRIGEHLRRSLTYYNKVATLRPRDYGTYLTAMEEVITNYKISAVKRGKHLVFTVHQRRIEVPLEDVKINKNVDVKGNITETAEGTFSLRLVPSLDGQIAEKLAGYFNEVYVLSATPEARGRMKYLARTVPDGQSDARTSRKLDEYIPADLQYVLDH